MSSEEDQRRLWASGNTYYAVMSGSENRGIKHQSCEFREGTSEQMKKIKYKYRLLAFLLQRKQKSGTGTREERWIKALLLLSLLK